MKQLYFLFLVSIALAGNFAQAAVSINEVAWMGGVESANYEWIEIYNDSDTSLSVDGWTLTDGVNLVIKLVGTISSNAYAVLERTSEVSAPTQAFLIYTGALVNTGATLVLSDVNGQVIDQVTGGIDWQNIGGDNTTKETAQYSVSGWVTDIGTPGLRNGAGRVEEEVLPEEELPTNSPSTTSVKKTSSSNSSDSVVLRNPESKMTLETDIQNIGYVNQEILFRVSAKGLSEADGKLVRYEWNFGDSYIATSTKAVHTYKFPGNYIVTIYAKNGKLQQVTRHEITILPVEISLSLNEAGNLQINNDSAYDVDVSNYLLRGFNSVILPPRTIITALGTITIESTRLNNKVSKDMAIILYDAKGKPVASSLTSNHKNEITEQVDDFKADDNLMIFDEILPSVELSSFDFVPKVAEASVVNSSIQETNSEKAEVVGTGTRDNSDKSRWPYLALVGLLVIVLFSILITKK